MNFLVLGNTGCRYCKQATLVLEDYGCDYVYLHLSSIYGEGNWRQAFTDLTTLVRDQRSIPFVFRVNTSLPADLTPETILSELKANTEFIGGFNELEEYLEKYATSDGEDY